MGNRTGELISFTKKLAHFIRQDIPVPDIIDKTGGDLKDRRLRDAFQNVAGEMKQGKTFPLALEAYPGIYPDYILDVIRAGEERGKLAEALEESAAFMEEKARLKNLIGKAFNLILIPIDVTILIFLYMVLVFFPHFLSLFYGMQLDLAFPTQIMMIITDTFQNRMLLLMLFSILILINILFLSDFRFRSRWIYNLFPSGNPVRKYDMFLLARCMSIMTNMGAESADAYNTAVKAVGKGPFGRVAGEIREALVEQGEFFRVILQVKGIPGQFKWMIRKADFRNGEGQVMGTTAEYYKKDLEQYKTKMEKTGGNLYMVIIGLIILFCVISVMMQFYPYYINVI